MRPLQARILALICMLLVPSPATARTVTSLALDGAGYVFVEDNPQLNSTSTIIIFWLVYPKINNRKSCCRRNNLQFICRKLQITFYCIYCLPFGMQV